jgi:hypothetical protein
MKTFKDASGREWTIDINLNTIEQVIASCKIDLTALFEGELKTLAELFNTPKLLVSVLWVLCGPEKPDALLSEKAFKATMKGDFLEAGANALVDDVIDFFPLARKREVCRAIAVKMQETAEAERQHIETKVGQFDPVAFLASATSSQASLASTPAASPSES